MNTKKINQHNIGPSDSDEIERERISYTSLDALLNDKGLIEKLLEINKQPQTEHTKAERKKLVAKLTRLHGLDNGSWLADISGKEEHMIALLKIRKDLITEFQCTTGSEFMLVDKITAAYWRSMHYEKYIHRLVERTNGNFSFDQLLINVLKELHKGLDQASRDLNANLSLLKGIKQPNLKINVKTDNAYIGQNQQIVNNPPTKDDSKIIDAD